MKITLRQVVIGIIVSIAMASCVQIHDGWLGYESGMMDIIDQQLVYFYGVDELCDRNNNTIQWVFANNTMQYEVAICNSKTRLQVTVVDKIELANRIRQAQIDRAVYYFMNSSFAFHSESTGRLYFEYAPKWMPILTMCMTVFWLCRFLYNYGVYPEFQKRKKEAIRQQAQQKFQKHQQDPEQYSDTSPPHSSNNNSLSLRATHSAKAAAHSVSNANTVTNYTMTPTIIDRSQLQHRYHNNMFEQPFDDPILVDHSPTPDARI